MKKEQIVDNLEKLLMAIHREVVVIRDADARMPKHEMDKTLSNIRALYEQFTVLNYLNTFGEEEPKQAPKPLIESVPEPKKPQPDEKLQPVQESPFEPIIETVQQPQSTEVKKNDETPVFTQTKPVVENIPVKAAETKASQTEITPAKELTLGDKLRLQKLEDLNKGISMADKFLFMNDLFKGENATLKEAVDMLNRLSTAEEAERYLNSLSLAYGWEENPKTEKKFRELVSRKFQ